MAKLALLVLIINTSTSQCRRVRLAQEVEIMTKQLELVTAQRQLLFLRAVTAFNAFYLNTSISKKNNVKHVLHLRSIIFNQKLVYFVLVKNHLTTAIDVLNVVLIKNTTVIVLNVKIATMVESTIQLQNNVNAKIHSSSMMELNVLIVSILNTSIILKIFARFALKIKFITSNSRNAFNALKIILSLMEQDALSAQKIHFGIKQANNVKPVKLDNSL
jgi:hypothetical protein